jgi:glycosyltransferase involved in cell wall biosynthesis
MRVLYYLSSSRIPSREANSVQVMKMCEAFASEAAVVVFAAEGDGADLDERDYYGVADSFRLVKIHRPRLRVLGAVAYIVGLVGRLRRFPRPDLYYGRYAPALWMVRRHGVHLVYEAHAVPQSRAHRALERALFRHPGFRGLVVITEALRRAYERIFPEVAGRILVAPDAAVDPGVRPCTRHEAGCSRNGDGRPRVGYIGSLLPGKGVEIIGPLAGLVPDFDFDIIGGDPAIVQSCRANYSARNLTFLGHIPPGRVPSACLEYDYLLAPYQTAVYGAGVTTDISRWMSPLKLFEYMAAGKPIVCSDLPVLREIMEDGRNCLMVPPGDLGAWADALSRLQSDPALACRLARAARSDFEQRFSWQRRADRILKFAGAA